ncbi:MAG: hypothetical protein AMJ65_01860 [Phycisphaerae bacterium SG8_4]|nr:MAG: hypothetical protein AMJ65_01860 [Phycisphaerae bacterium SG8_4]
MIRRGGFTLTEFVLFALLLSVLVVVVPNVSGAGRENRSLDLATYLLGVRSKIELYKVHHNGQLPTLTGENFTSFLHRMATKTNVDGDPGVDFGPYLQCLPINPFNDSARIRIDGTAAGANLAGWRFDTRTGAFQADDSPGHAMF